MPDEFDPGGDSDDENGASPKGRPLSDSLKRALVSGISAVFMTEEGIRNAIGDMRLPKDAMAYLLAQTERSRRELFRALSEELKGVLQGLDVSGAMRKALLGMRVEVKAEVRFAEDTGAATTQVETKVRRDEPAPSTEKRRATADDTTAPSPDRGLDDDPPHKSASAPRPPRRARPPKRT